MTMLTEQGRAALDRIKSANALNKEDRALFESIDRTAPVEVLEENLNIVTEELASRKMQGAPVLGLSLVKLEIEEILRGRRKIAQKTD